MSFKDIDLEKEMTGYASIDKPWRKFYSKEALESDLPKTVREKAINAAVKMQMKARRRRENKIEVKKLENGYHVTFTISDKDDVLMSLTVYVADITQVEIIKQGFLNDPVGLYSAIIASLTT